MDLTGQCLVSINLNGLAFIPFQHKKKLYVFCSSCLEWRHTYPKLEKEGIECWAVDILGWGFSCTGMSVFLYSFIGDKR
jgi:hypothetical protein